MRLAPPRDLRLLLVPVLVGCGVAAAPTGAALAAPAPSSSTAHGVIVLLRDQHTDLSLSAGTRSPRALAVRADEAPLLAKARSIGATSVHPYTLINGFAADLTDGQQAQLASDPSVAAVYPDLQIPALTAQRETPATATASTRKSAMIRDGACPASASKPLLEPEALQVMNGAFRDKKRPQAQNIVNGHGVKVAFMADGLNIDNPDFIRADGRHVFVDYQDFSGEGRNAPSSAAEAFGDASAIAAQGRRVYDLSNYATYHHVPKGCTIKVRGMAPGASLVGLKVFGNQPTAPTSRFIDAVDWAVTHDHVDVLNQSFGANPYPDNGNDPISLADRAATAAGVTVTVSTGDSGTSGTTGSPATSPEVIAVAASTTFRIYRQLTGGGEQLGNGTWADNNVSGISSGGVSQNVRVPDVMAPGDLGWALCSKNTTVYEDCMDDLGNPTNLLVFGGTSMAAPLTAGTAALVIQAYRRAHHGADPSPALVKRFITSTATDENHPAYEQGAGLVNALAAVRAAQSWHDGNGSPKAKGNDLVLAGTQASVIGAPGSTHTSTVTVRNVSAKRQTISAATRVLGKTVQSTSGRRVLNTDSAPTYIDQYGIARSYAKSRFTVRGGVDRLDVSAAAPIKTGAALRIVLIDPHGRFTAYSIPQGANNYAHVDVHHPVAGTWTAYYAVSQSSSYHGYVFYKATTSDYTRAGTVTPSSRSVAPGGTATFTVHSTLPAQPGDRSESVQLTGSAGDHASMPLSLRSVVPAHATTFAGTVTGGNGRGVLPAQANSYYLRVPKGKHDLSVDVTLSDARTTVSGVLVAPSGQVYSYKSSTSSPAHRGMVLNALRPRAGTWVLTLAFANPVSGFSVTQKFSARVSYNDAQVTAALPNSAKTRLAKGKTVRVPIRITNTTRTAQRYFVDARLFRTGTIQLAELTGNSHNIALPVAPGIYPTWLVPSDTTGLTIGARADQPVNLDTFFSSGEPEVYASHKGNGATVHVHAPYVSPGLWSADIGQSGPFRTTAPTGSVSVFARAYGRLFDTAVSSSTGDLWTVGVSSQSSGMSAAYLPTSSRLAASPRAAAASSQQVPLLLLPGETGRIIVKVTPSGRSGRVVNGQIIVNSFDRYLSAGDQIAALHYRYTVK